MMKNTLIIGLLLFFCSCDSFLEDYSQDLATVENITDLDELLLGGVYHPAGYQYIQNSALHTEGERLNLFIHFMSDELKKTEQFCENDYYNTCQKEMFGYYTWQRQVGIDVDNSSVSPEDASWNLTYKYISVANMILGELDEVKTSTDKEALDKLRVEGETRFLRALYYFTLVNLYADPYVPSKAVSTPGIPLKLTSYIEDKDYTRNTVEEVYGAILSDLKRAEECLSQTERKSVYRADITAVYLLKSRVYLYMQNYRNARTYAQYVLDRNSALEDLRTFSGSDNVFTSASSEVIFSMGGHLLSAYLYGQDRSDDGPFFISDELLAAFDNKDLRKSKYIAPNTNDDYTYKKIYWGCAHYGAQCSVSDNFLFRTSEAYLNLAEAAAFDDDEGTARRMIGELQAKRFNSAPSVTESGNDLIDLIRKERQRELCLEGHRWYDLRRYTVCEKYPWSYAFRHTYADWALDWWDYLLRSERTYELEAFDKAYTMAFPKEVIEFQNTIATNDRPERMPVSSNE